MNACTSQACQQGKSACPFPAACQVPMEEESLERDLATAIITAAIALCLLAVAAAVFW
jgi:hypothetical protein